MSIKKLSFNDNMSKVVDEVEGVGGFKFRGAVECRNELGEMLFEKDNLIVVPGRRFVLEKLFNIKSTLLFNSLRQLMNVAPQIDEDPTLEANGPLKAKAVCLFGVGIGGSGMTFGDVIDPKYTDLNLNQIIPLRLVDITNDLSATEKAHYYLRVVQGDKVAYYLKKFEAPAEIKIKD